jgi:hypothetical protein
MFEETTICLERIFKWLDDEEKSTADGMDILECVFGVDETMAEASNSDRPMIQIIYKCVEEMHTFRCKLLNEGIRYINSDKIVMSVVKDEYCRYSRIKCYMDELCKTLNDLYPNWMVATVNMMSGIVCPTLKEKYEELSTELSQLLRTTVTVPQYIDDGIKKSYL